MLGKIVVYRAIHRGYAASLPPGGRWAGYAGSEEERRALKVSSRPATYAKP